MPYYQYECEKCGNDFEVLQKMSDEPISTCPKCGGNVHKVIANFGVSFIGTGFYANDSKNSKSISKSTNNSCSASSCSGCSGCKS